MWWCAISSLQSFWSYPGSIWGWLLIERKLSLLFSKKSAGNKLC
jgi:hypothetical protein